MPDTTRPAPHVSEESPPGGLDTAQQVSAASKPVGGWAKFGTGLASVTVGCAVGLATAVGSLTYLDRSFGQISCPPGNYYCGVVPALSALAGAVVGGLLISFFVGRSVARALLPKKEADEAFARAVLLLVSLLIVAGMATG